MRVLQINTVYKEKSTGRTCFEVEKALLEQGHECITAYGIGNHKGDHAYRIDNHIEYFVHNFLSRLTGLEGYFSYFATKRLIRFIKKYSPDIIHLRNLHGHYLNLPLLFNYLSTLNIPIIQNLHDHWAFTGKCPYYTAPNCQKWQNECGACPLIKSYPVSWFFDRTKKMLRDKKKMYAKVKNLTVIGVSEWTRDEAKKSFLASVSSDIRTIYNWIDVETFKPHDINKRDVLKRYNIPDDKFIILGVSANWNPSSPRFIDFMELAKKLRKDEIIVLVGSSKTVISLNGVYHIPFTKNVIELAFLYNCADVYVHCSSEDTFGKVIAEAQSCGTPALTYDITGCREIVKNGESGYLINPRDINEIRIKIDEIKKNGKGYYSSCAINNVKNRFLYETNVKKLIDLYNEKINYR